MPRRGPAAAGTKASADQQTQALGGPRLTFDPFLSVSFTAPGYLVRQKGVSVQEAEKRSEILCTGTAFLLHALQMGAAF
jgi:hypothetical protein